MWFRELKRFKTHIKIYKNISILFILWKNTYKPNNSCILNVFNYILTDSLASNFVDSGGTCNTQMEGQKDAETCVYTWIEMTDTVHANSDLVSEIGFLTNSEKPSVTHTESKGQTVFEVEHTHVLYTRCHNDTIGVSDNEIDSGTGTCTTQNIDEKALAEIQGVDDPMHSGNHFYLAVYNTKLISFEYFVSKNFIGLDTTFSENRLNT